MDKKVEILLNNKENIKSVNVDMFDKIELKNQPNLIREYDIRNVVSATKVFNEERQNTPIYRIYGKIEYLSLLNGLKKDYMYLEDFFNPQTTNEKNLLNSFNFYLVKPATGYTHYSGVKYLRRFEVIATPNEFEIYRAGFSNNVFGEQEYAFNFNIDFDISNYFDYFGFPITEIYLYAEYVKKDTFFFGEKLYRTIWSTSGSHIVEFETKPLNIGDYVETSLNSKIVDLIEYSKENYYQRIDEPQTFYIDTSYNDGGTLKYLQWKYNPFIPIRLRYLSNDVYKANTGNTVYAQVQSIPSYATKLDNNGNYVWRKILEQGFIDPLTNIGVNYPFVNKRRYLFTNIILDMQPNLSHTNTLNVFNEVWFSRYAETLNVKPIGDIKDIGKPCQ